MQFFTVCAIVENEISCSAWQRSDGCISVICLQLNEGEQSSICAFVSMEGLSVSVINQMYHEVALLSVASSPSMWEVEVNNRWKILNVELATWLEDQWKSEQDHANLHDQIEVGGG